MRVYVSSVLDLEVMRSAALATVGMMLRDGVGGLWMDVLSGRPANADCADQLLAAGVLSFASRTDTNRIPCALLSHSSLPP